MLNSVRHVDSVNDYRMIFKMHYSVKRDCRTFGMRERTGFAGPKRVTAVEVPLQRIFTALLAQFCEVLRLKGLIEDLFEIFRKDCGESSCRFKERTRTFFMM